MENSEVSKRTAAVSKNSRLRIPTEDGSISLKELVDRRRLRRMQQKEAGERAGRRISSDDDSDETQSSRVAGAVDSPSLWDPILGIRRDIKSGPILEVSSAMEGTPETREERLWRRYNSAKKAPESEITEWTPVRSQPSQSVGGLEGSRKASLVSYKSLPVPKTAYEEEALPKEEDPWRKSADHYQKWYRDNAWLFGKQKAESKEVKQEKIVDQFPMPVRGGDIHNLDSGGHRVEGQGKGQTLADAHDRLLREEAAAVKHDKSFSEWKILVGPTDWADHAVGKEGAVRYRVFNLPQTYFGPGVYELGIVNENKTAGRKLKNSDVVAVYVGQAENIRQRLQQYGQGGSHLGQKAQHVPTPRRIPIPRPHSPREEALPRSATDYGGGALRETLSSRSHEKWSPLTEAGGVQSAMGRRRLFLSEATFEFERPANRDSLWATMDELDDRDQSSSVATGPGLFTDVFEKGYSVAFRWAKALSKEAAMVAEAKLLDTFDYAWNYQLNGRRRPAHAFAVLENGRPQRILSCFCFRTRRVGTHVSIQKPAEDSHRVNVILTAQADRVSKGQLPHKPHLLASPAIRARRRSQSFLADVQLRMPAVGLPRHQTDGIQFSIPANSTALQQRHPQQMRSEAMGRLQPDDWDSEDFVGVRDPTQGGKLCGASLGHGFSCIEKPVAGRRRCAAHKGVKVFIQV